MSGEKNYRSGFAAVIGPANAGKSTLINAVVGRKISIVSPKQQTTRNRILGVKTRSDGQIIVLDTPGFVSPSRRSALSKYMSDTLSFSRADVDVSVLVIDGHKALGDDEEVPRVLGFVRQHEIPNLRVLAINKIDLFDKRLLLPLIARLQELFGPLGVPGFECVPISALNIDGVTLLEDCILQGLPEGPPLFPEDAVTDQPDEFYAAEIIREKLIGRLGQELPYSLAVQIERWQEEDSLLRLNAVIFVERDSQKAIVIGKGGTMLKSVGTAARLELERFFGTKVYLELFVKVEKAWTSSERGLSKAGYRAGNSY